MQRVVSVKNPFRILISDIAFLDFGRLDAVRGLGLVPGWRQIALPVQRVDLPYERAARDMPPALAPAAGFDCRGECL